MRQLPGGTAVLAGARKIAHRFRWAMKVSAEGIKDARHATRRGIERVRAGALNLVKNGWRRVRRPLRAAARRKAHLSERLGFYRIERRIERELEQLTGRGRLLVAGPWLSEVGFEALYWVPFLHWVQTAFRVPRERLIAVSRGGVAAWYAGVASRYIDIWDEMSPEEFGRRNRQRGVVKQHGLSPLDCDVLESVARRLGTRDFGVIHPGLMYELFGLYWSGQRAMGFLDEHTRFTRMNAAAVIDPTLLPKDYVAVKFYSARALPDTPAVRLALRDIVARIADRSPVVLLDTGLVLGDDHADYAFGGARVVSARPWMTARNNLGVQTQIVASARAYVGTCGSLAWLAPRLGVATSAVFVDPKWLHAHIPVAMRAYHKLAGAGRFAVSDLRALDPWRTDLASPEPARVDALR